MLNQGILYWATFKDVGKVHVQVVVDILCHLALANAYTAKFPATPWDLMYGSILSFYEDLDVSVGTCLTNNGRELCGNLEMHPYELPLAMECIAHRTTKHRSPRTNRFVERTNCTLLDDCFRVTGRTTCYPEAAEIQRDLDRFLECYNRQRSHQGQRLNRRTPPHNQMETLNITYLPKLAEEGPAPDAGVSTEAIS